MDQIDESNVLYDHQKKAVKRATEFETNVYDFKENFKLRSSIGILGDLPGTGKSYIMMALISKTITSNSDCTTTIPFVSNKISVSMTIKNDMFYNTTIIVTTTNKLKTWIQCAKTFNMDYAIIRNINDIKKKEAVKSVTFVTNTMYNAYADHLKQKFVYRIVYDDADVINIINCRFIESRFHWFISSFYQNLLHPCGAGWIIHKPHVKSRLFPGIKSSGFIKYLFKELCSTAFGRSVCVSITIKSTDTILNTSLNLPNIIRNDIICQENNLLELLKSDLRSAINILDDCNRYLDEKRIIQWIDGKQNIKRIQNSKMCIICHDVIEHKTITRCCSNAFCLKCLGNWLNVNNKCPMCKHVIKPHADLFVYRDSDFKKQMGDTLATKHANLSIILNKVLQNEGKYVMIFGITDTQTNQITSKYTKQIYFVESVFKIRKKNLDHITDIILFDDLHTIIQPQLIRKIHRIGQRHEITVWSLKTQKELKQNVIYIEE